MSVRRDEYFERFRELTTERGWTEDQQMFVGRIAVHGSGSTSNMLDILEAAFEIEDAIREETTEQAVEDYHRVFTPDEFKRVKGIE